jgi:hypothetical protein
MQAKTEKFWRTVGEILERGFDRSRPLSLKRRPAYEGARNLINGGAFLPVNNMKRCGSANFFVRQCYRRKRWQKEVGNAHHIIESKNANIFGDP